MNEEPNPIGRLLDDDLDDARIARLWQRTSPATKARPWRRPALAAGALALAAAALLVFLRSPSPSSELLAMHDGSPLGKLNASSPRTLAFSDGSRVRLAAGTRLVPRANRTGSVELALARGRARFEVRPNGPRRWTVTAGEIRVDVLGTIFTVEREDARVSVSVERGVVRVTSVDQQVTLRAGDRFAIGDEESTAELRETAASEVRVPPVEVVSEETGSPARARAPRGPAWTSLAERGEHRRAWEALGRHGVRERARDASAHELLLLADVARLSGHPAEAVDPLERLLASHPRAPEAPLGAITLGRLELHVFHRPARAARAFETALALRVPSSLDEEVRADLAIALHRAGDTDRARAAAEDYLRRHPNGPHASSIPQ